MGIKVTAEEKKGGIRKRIFCFFVAFLSIVSLCFLSVPANAQSTNPIVRVAISNNNFKTFVYGEISIVATSEFGLYDKSTALPIAKFLPDDIVKIKIKDNKFEVFVNDKSVAKNITNPMVFDCRNGLLGIKDLKRRGRQALYHGNLEIIPKNETSFYLVNSLDLQEYLKGVVPNEMPVRFGLEALKAQAVAARNYVLMPRTRCFSEFDVDDSVASQVYYGANSEDPLATRAVVETQGLVALYKSQLILAQYCSTAGGYTEDWQNAFPDNKTKLFFKINPKPYLKGRPDMLTMTPLNNEEAARKFYMSTPESYDMRSPYYRWKREFLKAELEDTLPKMLISQSKTGFVAPKFEQGDDFGELKEIKVLKRGVSGKVMELEIVSSKGSWKVSKELVIRRVFPKKGVSLPSANVVFDQILDDKGQLVSVTAYGGGFGHGVGMSQFGAGFMSTELHKTFDKILKRYYTGITISTIPVVICSNPEQKVVHIQFFAPQKKAVLVVQNSFHVKNVSVNINNTNVPIKLDVTPILSELHRIDISEYIRKGKNDVVFTFPEEEKNKSIKIYIELVEKDDSEYSF